MKQRISSWLLVLCMVLALLPVTQLPAAAVASDSGRTVLTAASTTLSDGTYYLAGDVNLSQSIEVTGTVTLDLNGHVLKMTGNDSVIKVQNGGKLTLIDSNPTATNTVGGKTISGGVITGGKATNGSGVYVASGGTFVANGGVVAKDNSVYVASGGTITNTTTSEDLFKENLASATVFFSSPEFQGSAGNNRLVTFNIGSGTSPDSWSGKDYAWEIVQQDGYPVNPDSRYVWLYYQEDNHTFASFDFFGMNLRPDISELYAYEPVQLSSANLEAGTLTFEDGKSYQLTEDISISSAITVRSTQEFVTVNALDLNGYVLKMTGNDSVIKVESSGQLTLIDSRPTATNMVGGKTISGGVITGGKATNGKATRGGGVYAEVFTMNGGTITNCTASEYGGGVYVAGKFVMNGGTITNCTASEYGGGAFAISSFFAFDMNGGTITDCSATEGGDVYVFLNTLGGSGVFNMNGGVIGDVYVSGGDSGVVNMNGGVIGYSGSNVHFQADVNFTISNTAAYSTTICYSSFPLTSKLAADNYLVTFKDGNSTYAYEVVKKGGKAVEVPIKEAGYVWYNGDKLFDFSKDTVNSNLTLMKTAKSYTITYVLNGGTNDGRNPETYKVTDTPIVLYDPSRSGYNFTGWTGSPLPNGQIPNGKTGDLTYTANWEEKSNYTVEFDSKGGTEVGTKTNVKWTGKVLDGIVAPSKPGYTFKGWTYNDNAVGTNTTYGSLVPNDDKDSITLTANWEEKSNYEVVFDSKGGTEVESKTGVKWTDKILDKVETTRAGYTFKGWTYNGNAVGANTTYGSLVPNDDKTSITLTASWEEKSSYTVVFTSDGDTVGTKNDVKWTDSVLNGVEHPSKKGYTFQGWKYNDNAVGTDATYGSLVPDDDKDSITLTANWEEKSNYEVVFDSQDGTEVESKTGVQWTDKILDKVETTRAGYTFKGWTYNGNAVGADTTYGSLVPNDDKTSITLTAIWEENHNYTVVFDSKGGTEVEPKNNVKWTDRVLDGVEHPRRVDWEFKGWTLNGQPVTAESTYGELVGDEHDEVMSITLTAEWLYTPACSFIEATAGEGGSISPAGFSVVLDGNDKTFTITADSGYLIADVLVDGESVGAVSTYTFTDVRVDHTIEAKFELVQFEDCAEDDWFYPDIIYVASNGIMRGTGSGEFSPDVLTTRGMLVTMLYRLDGEPEVSGSCRFSDVQAGSYCEAAVIWASENGIVNGYDNGLFGTNDDITREQLAVILYRYAEFKGLDVSAGEDTDLLSYSDASETAGYALPAMKWMCGVGILHGNDNNQLMPKGSATRAEVAAILHRFCENILK